MKILLDNTNKAISSIVSICCERAGVSFEEYKEKTDYDLLIKDCEKDTDISEFDKTNTLFLIPKGSAGIFNAKYFIEKPFLPTDLIQFFSKFSQKQNDSLHSDNDYFEEGAVNSDLQDKTMIEKEDLKSKEEFLDEQMSEKISQDIKNISSIVKEIDDLDVNSSLNVADLDDVMFEIDNELIKTDPKNIKDSEKSFNLENDINLIDSEKSLEEIAMELEEFEKTAKESKIVFNEKLEQIKSDIKEEIKSLENKNKEIKDEISTIFSDIEQYFAMKKSKLGLDEEGLAPVFNEAKSIINTHIQELKTKKDDFFHNIEENISDIKDEFSQKSIIAKINEAKPDFDEIKAGFKEKVKEVKRQFKDIKEVIENNVILLKDEIEKEFLDLNYQKSVKSNTSEIAAIPVVKFDEQFSKKEPEDNFAIDSLKEEIKAGVSSGINDFFNNSSIKDILKDLKININISFEDK